MDSPFQRVACDLPHVPAGRPARVRCPGGSLEADAIAELLKRLAGAGIDFKDLHSSESSLEDIFVSLVHAGKPAGPPANDVNDNREHA